MTREQIESRIQQLTAERAQIIANVNAYNGAIQECQRWIAECDTEAAKRSELKLAADELLQRAESAAAVG